MPDSRNETKRSDYNVDGDTWSRLEADPATVALMLAVDRAVAEQVPAVHIRRIVDFGLMDRPAETPGEQPGCQPGG